MAQNEFNYHLNWVAENAAKYIEGSKTLVVEHTKLQRKYNALDKVVQALPNSEEILKIADKVRSGIPLFSRSEITHIQEGLRDYATELRDQLNLEIENISKVIEQTKK